MHNYIPSLLELQRRRQTRNLILVLGIHIGNNAILPRRDLLRQRHIFRQLRVTLIKRTFEVDVLDGVAQVGGLLDDGDEAVFDLEVDGGALFDFFGESTFGCDRQVLATRRKDMLAWRSSHGWFGRVEEGRWVVRLRGVGIQIHTLQLQNVILRVLAMLQRVLAGNFERLVEGCDIWRAAKEAGAGGDSCRQQRRGEEGEEFHAVIACVDGGVCVVSVGWW